MMNEPRHPTVDKVVSSLQEVFALGGLSALPVFVDDGPWEPTIVEPIHIQGRIGLAAMLDEALPCFGTIYVLAVGSNGGRRICDDLVFIGREITFIPIVVSPDWLHGDQQVAMKHVGRDSQAAAQASTARSGARTAHRLRDCPQTRSAHLDPIRKFFTCGLEMG